MFIGRNYDYFLRKWEIAEQKKSKTSWNWAAFVFGGRGWLTGRCISTRGYLSAWWF